jgi:hypothetical protein
MHTAWAVMVEADRMAMVMMQFEPCEWASVKR